MIAIDEIQTHRIIDGDGHVIPRSVFLQAIERGTLKHSAVPDSGRSVRVYGNAAVVTARSRSEGVYAGSAFSTDEISTDIWIRKDGRWQCVLTQLTGRKS